MNASEASRNSSASADSRNSSASSASSIKTLYVINHLRDVERMLTSMPPIMATLKLTISYMEMTLSSTVSFPDFLSITPNLMTNNCEKLSNIQTVSIRKYQHLFRFSLSAPSWSFFGSGFILPKLSGSRTETKAKQKCSSSNLFKPWSHYLPHLSLTWLVAL